MDNLSRRIITAALVLLLAVPASLWAGPVPGATAAGSFVADAAQLSELGTGGTEALDGWGPTWHWWDNGDGTRSAEAFTGPAFFEDGATGSWAPIDLALEAVGGGLLRAVSGPASLPRLSTDLADPAVSVPAGPGELRVWYPGASPVAGVVGERDVSFPDALGVGRDLKLVLTTTGYEEFVVVPDAAASGTYTVEFTVPHGVTAESDGWGVRFVDGDGQPFSVFGHGTASDSAFGAAGVGVEFPVRTRVTGQSGQTVSVEVGVAEDWLVIIDASGMERFTLRTNYDAEGQPRAFPGGDDVDEFLWDHLPIIAMRYHGAGDMVLQVDGRAAAGANQLQQDVSVWLVHPVNQARFNQTINFASKDLRLRFYGWVLGPDGRKYNRDGDELKSGFWHYVRWGVNNDLPFSPQFEAGPDQGNVMNVRPGETLYVIPNLYDAFLSQVVNGDPLSTDRRRWHAKNRFNVWQTDWLFQIMLHQLAADPLGCNRSGSLGC